MHIRLLHALENLSAQENACIKTEDWAALDQLLDRQLPLIEKLAEQLQAIPSATIGPDLRTRIQNLQANYAGRIRQLSDIKATEHARLRELEAGRRHLVSMRQTTARSHRLSAIS